MSLRRFMVQFVMASAGLGIVIQIGSLAAVGMLLLFWAHNIEKHHGS